jgi:hypothetical protein
MAVCALCSADRSLKTTSMAPQVSPPGRARPRRTRGVQPIPVPPGRTAIHEAGHAVLGRVLTLVCGGATIQMDHESYGHAITEDPYVTLDAWAWRGKVRSLNAVWIARTITFMAGAEAVAELSPDGLEPGDDGDRRQIADMLEEIAPPDPVWYEARLRKMTRMLIRRHRERIERVANALLTNITLSTEELDKLVGRSVADVKVPPFLLAVQSRHATGR